MHIGDVIRVNEENMMVCFWMRNYYFFEYLNDLYGHLNAALNVFLDHLNRNLIRNGICIKVKF